VVSTVGPILRPCVSNLFRERPLETIGSRIPFLSFSFHRYTLLGDARSHARSHEDSASLGAVATYGLVSDQSLAPSWRSSPARLKAIILLRLRRRPGDRTALGAEAAYGLTSDQSTSAIGYPSSPVCPLVHALTSITTPSWRPHHHRCRSCRWTDQ
jgi:hypothetical protein